jgi:phage RecT family recombinase
MPTATPHTSPTKPPANQAAVPSSPPAKSAETKLAVLERQILRVLPQHVGYDKFMRVVETALNANPRWSQNRRTLLSLYQAALKCAQDGLLPDGREAVFVAFREKGGAEIVQYMPMTYGIMKKVRNSGELLSLTVNAVFIHDEFRYWVDDAGEHITHEPDVDSGDRGKVKAAYAIAKTKDGGVYTEVMDRGQIEQVRGVSKSATGPAWSSWYDEMARKSVFKRLAKRLPMSADLERTVGRDNDMVDLGRVRERTERTGADAAKHLLGLAEEVAAIEGDERAIDEPAPPATPKFDEHTANVHIAEATSVDQLTDRWVEIADDYFGTAREIPVQLDGAYKARLETLQQAAAKP